MDITISIQEPEFKEGDSVQVVYKERNGETLGDIELVVNSLTHIYSTVVRGKLYYSHVSHEYQLINKYGHIYEFKTNSQQWLKAVD